MSDKSIQTLKNELAKGHSNLVRRYLDASVEALSEAKDAGDTVVSAEVKVAVNHYI